MNKICSICGKEKPIQRFKSWQNKSGETKYIPSCSACDSKKYRQKNTSNHKKIQQRAKQKYNKNKFAMKNALLKHINQIYCQQCGEDNQVVLCFHHLNPKEKKFNIKWAMTHSYALDTMKKEVEKCCVLCANCHMMFHYLGENCIRPEHQKRAKRTATIKKSLMEQIGQTSCKVCGTTDALTFHHRNPKEKKFTISNEINRNKIPYEDLLVEAKKCDVLCANCHFSAHLL